MTESMGGYQEVFRSVPFPVLLLDAELRVVDATRAYQETVGPVDDVVGHFVFDAFPTADETSDGLSTIEASLRRVLASGRRDQLPLIEYAVESSRGAGFFERRWWTVVNMPVHDGGGRVVGVLNAVDEVTDVVHERERSRRALEEAVELRTRTEELEEDLSRRSRELVATTEAERSSSRRLAGMAEAALELAAAETVQGLLEAVFGRGLVALGADGGAVAVLDENGENLLVTLTEGHTDQARRTYAQIPLAGPLPVSVATRTGDVVLLRNEAEGLAFTPEMGPVHETTGKVASASLPLLAGGVPLGAITASWNQPREFAETDVRLLDALSAQCSLSLHRVLQREAERAAVAQTRQLAEALQRSLLTEPPQPDHLQIAVRYLPAARDVEIGGDWYDAFLVNGVTSLVVADVTGHDQEAATTMGQLRGLLRGVAHARSGSPAAILSGLDAAMADLGQDKLTTAVVAQIEQSRREADHDLRLLRWSNAGHPPPLLLHPDGSAEFLERPVDLLLGLDPKAERHDHTHLLPAGSTVLLYSDGLVERRGDDLARGNAWLASAASDLVGLPLEEMCDALLQELVGKLEDDVALLALRPFTETRPRPAEAGTEAVHEASAPPPVAAPGPRTLQLPSGSGSEASVMLPCDPASVRRARAFVTAFCTRQGLVEDLCETAVLLTSEVVTNAVLHGRSDFRLALRALPDGLHVGVKDANSRHPKQVASDGDALDGRGIAIVELLARDWGVRDEPPGKVVWFELAAEPATA